MNKITTFLCIVAIGCFVLCNVKKHKLLKEITNDFDQEVYINIGHKEYTKEVLIKYYKQVLRYINYFIFFYDFESLDTVIYEEDC